MADRSAIYSRYSDNILRGATASIASGTPTGDPRYDASALIDDNPAAVAKLNSTSGAWDFDCGSAKRGQLIALIHHDFQESATVTVTAGASQGASTLSATFTIPPWIATGRGRWPVNPWLDLTKAAGYSAGGFRWWRISVSGNDQNLQLGQVVIASTLRRLDPDLQWDFSTGRQRTSTVNQTYMGVKVKTPIGDNVWRRSGQHVATPAVAADMDALFVDACGQSLPWLLVPDGTVNEAYYVTFAGDYREYKTPEHQNPVWQFDVEEVNRGLRPGA